MVTMIYRGDEEDEEEEEEDDEEEEVDDERREKTMDTAGYCPFSWSSIQVDKVSVRLLERIVAPVLIFMAASWRTSCSIH